MGQQPTYEELKQKVAELEAAGTKWKRMEQELEEKNKDLQNHSRLLDIMTGQMIDMVYHKDKDFRYVFSSKPHCDRILKCTQEECVGLTDVEIAERYRQGVHEQGFGEICVNSDQETKEAGKPSQFEEVATVDGEEIWLRVYKTPLCDEAGKFAGIIGCSKEISERKRVEEELRKHRDHLEELIKERTDELTRSNEALKKEVAQTKEAAKSLRESEEKFRSLTEQSPNMIFINKKGKVVYANKRCEEVTGYKCEDFYSPNFDFMSLIAPESKELIKRKFKLHLAGEEVEPYEYTILSKDGKRIEVINAPKLIEYEGARAILGMITDITERKRAGQALEQSEGLYRSTIDAMGDEIFVIDSSFRITLANEPLLAQWYRKYGMEAEILGKKVFEALPFFSDKARDEYKQVIKSREALVTEEATVLGDKRMIAEIRKIPIVENDTVVRIVTVVRDITVKKQIEEALRDSEERYRAFVNQSADGMLLIDLETKRITSLNPALPRMLGYSLEELLKMPAYDFIAYDRKSIDQDFQEIIDRGYFRAERQYRKKDGTLVDVEISANLISYGGKKVISNVVRDISERKRADKMIQEEKDRAQNYLDIAAVMLLVKGADGKVKRINRKGCEVLGYEEDEIIDKPWLENFVPERIRPETQKVFDTLIADKNGEVDYYENPVLTKNGEERLIAWHNSLVKDESGNAIEYLGSGTDITEQKRTEEALRKSERQYRQLFEQSRDAICLTGRDGRVLDLNQAWSDLFGYTKEEMLALDGIKDLYVNPGARENFQQKIERKGFVRDYEVNLRKKDGTVLDILFDTTLLRDDDENIIGYQGIMRDVTERKQVEAALQEAFKKREELEKIVNRSPGVVFLWRATEGWPVEFVSENVREYGYRPEDFYSGKIAFADMVYPEDLERVAAEVSNHSNEEDRESFTQEYRIVTPFGDVRWIDNRTWIRRNEEGKVTHFQGIIFDITDRKQTEEALKESEQRLELALSGADLGLWDWNMETGEVKHNKRWAEMRGYRSEEIEESLRFFEENIHPDDHPEVTQALDSHIEGRSPFYEGEHRCKTKSGEWRWVLDRGKVVERDNNGKPIRAAGTNLEITEQKKAKESLRESEERVRTLVEQSPLGIQIFDTDGLLIQANKAWEEIWGTTAEGAIGKYSPLEDESLKKSDVYLLLKRVFAGESVSFPVAEFDPGMSGLHGRKRWILIRAYQIRDKAGEILNIVLFSEDVTERKQAEGALQESEKRYRDLVDNANSVILHWDAEGKIVFMNRFGLNYFGYSEEELIGRNVLGSIVSETEFTTKRDLTIMIKGIQGDLDKYKHNENENIRKDGSRVWLLWTNKAIRNKEGKAVEILSVGYDITPRKRAEEEKKRLEGQLLQAQKMKAIGTLAGGIAHDFNNLLMGIQGRVSLMSLDTDDKHPHANHHKGIEDMVRRGADLTGQLLGFARGGKYEVKPTDLNDLILKSSQMFGRTKKEVKISCLYQKDIWTVEIDQGQIEQVMLSLYVNAAQSMPGGGKLSVQTENVILQESSAEVFQVKSGKHVKVSATDTGTGMDEKTRERIFDPFFTTKEMGRGTGLSLASAYGVVKSHGGAIDVYSTEGEGTTIIIYLPASDKPVVKEKKVVAQKTAGGETVLLVDDEDMIIEIGEKILQSMGYKVLLAKSGREALKIYEENKDGIDIVLLDLVMPDMGGGEAYDRLKEIDPGLKVLLASGYSIDGQAKEILARGCDGFIQKPYNMKQLAEKIREILDKEA